MQKYAVRQCPVGNLVLPLHSQWAFPLLAELKRNPTSFSQLKRALNPVTSKMLSSCLRKAVQAGCSIKHQNKYQLSPEGARLFGMLKPLANAHVACRTCRGQEACNSS